MFLGMYAREETRKVGGVRCFLRGKSERRPAKWEGRSVFWGGLSCGPVVPWSRCLDSTRVGKNLPARREGDPQSEGRRGALGLGCAVS